MTNETMYMQSEAITMDDIIRRQQKIQTECTDHYMTGSKIARVSDDANSFTYYDTDGNQRTADFRIHSFSQLCTHFGVSGAYMNRCIDAHKPELAAYNLNEWLKENQRDFLIREYGDQMRGMLTTRYTIVDTPDILDIVTDSLDVDQYKICGHWQDSERLHIRMRDRDTLPIDGEDLFGGIQIDTSDVGRCGIAIRFFVWKQVCTNGLCTSRGGGILYKQKHIGVNPLEIRMALEKNLADLDKYRQTFIEAIVAAKKEKMDELDIQKILQKLKKEQSVGDKKLAEIVNLMDYKYGKSKFGIINGITEIAQGYNLEKRIQLETFAGNLLAA